MVAPVPIASSSGWAWTKMTLGPFCCAGTPATLRTGVPAGPHDKAGRLGDDAGVDYPEIATRTRRFSCGAPRAVTVTADGARVIFLRSSGPEDPADQLWIFDVATGEERLIADPAVLLASGESDLPAEERALRERLRLSTQGIGSYATDAAGLKI